jgi:hypothetical protein
MAQACDLRVIAHLAGLDELIETDGQRHQP